jgi:large subunit ribosomal protein L3
MKQLMAKKINMTQVFSETGKILPVTMVEIQPAVVTRLKDMDNDGYIAVQVGYGEKKPQKMTKPVAGQVKGISHNPRHFKEELVTSLASLEVGQVLSVADIFKVGDIISVTAWSKGKGFQGGVKRWGFAGGPKTHGQSDRHRAPGSIGSGTDPGRVWKGLHMAGHMGNKRITTQGLTIVSIDGNKIAIKGAVPGANQSLLVMKKQV